MNHPVQLHVQTPESMQRVHVFIRVALLVAMGTMGSSPVFWLAYLALPAIAALLIAQSGGEHYLTSHAPGIIRVLKWVAGAYAYLWLLTDQAPEVDQPGAVELEVHPNGRPTAGSALLRLLTSLPALIVLAVLSVVGTLLWLIGAIAILFARRAPGFVVDFLGVTLRYQFRLIAYHLSLVDAYPSFEEMRVAHASGAGTG